jgi:endonuclease/exonuclease/phosphatase (EEP) superfamily protein YafD
MRRRIRSWPTLNVGMVRIPLLVLLIVAAGCRSVRPPEPATGPHFTLLTYNVNWGGPRADLAVEIIRRETPDIICLQETNPEWEKYLRATLAREDRYMSFRDSVGRAGGGLGFLSKVPASEVAYVPSQTGWFDGWIMSFQTTVGKVQVLNVHLRPPVSDRGSWVSGYLSTDDDREREIEQFYVHCRKGLPVIVAGDFNDGERSGVLRWLQAQGMRNALPQFDYRPPTWQWRVSAITLQRRMDHIVYGPDLHCYEARVVRAGASDHYPVLGVFGTRTSAERTPAKSGLE